MKIWKAIGCAAALVVSGSGHASSTFAVSGIETLEWLELTSTVGLSREKVEYLLSDGKDLDGWRYASRGEVETLYDSLWGGTTEGYSEDNYQGARVFFDAFGLHTFYSATGYDEFGASSWQTLFGNKFECGLEVTTTCIGLVSIYDSNFGASLDVGYFHDDFGLSVGLDSINTQESATSLFGYPYIGSHLVREISEVPVPAALWLFASGLLSLVGISWRKNICNSIRGL